MPLPLTSLKKSSQKSSPALARSKADNDLLIKGILCTLIGLGVLVSPYFITSPGMQGIVANSVLVGWFALVLGLAFIGLFIRRRLRSLKPS